MFLYHIATLQIIFFATRPSTSVAFLLHRPSHPLPSRQFLSDSSEGDDEISKLINKRNQIKRKKKEDVASALETATEPVVDLDLDKLPEFKTERPVRRATPNEQDEEQQEDQTKKSDIPIVDFMAEYDDENDFHIPNRMGVSTRSWGDPARNFVDTGKLTKRMVKSGRFVPGDLQLAHTKLLEGGVTFFETTLVYGAASRSKKLSAVDILQRCLSEQASDLPETKVMVGLGQSAWSKVFKPTASMLASLEEALSRLDVSAVELFSIPKSLLFPSTFVANALAAAIESGQCNYAGVEGVTSESALRRLRRKLEVRDVTLTSNTFEFSLTNRENEAMIDVCKSMNVIPLISNPLDDGLASGVFTATNPSGGQQTGAKFTFQQLDKLQPLHSVLETVADRAGTRVRRQVRDTQERFKSRYGPPPRINTDITTTQVALNYVVYKGGVPLVEVNSPDDADQVLGCLGWQLSDDDVEMLDAAAALCNL